MKSFARFFLFGLVATSLPTAVFMLLVEIRFGVSWHVAGTVAILCALIVCHFYVKFSRAGPAVKNQNPLLRQMLRRGATVTHLFMRKIVGCIAGGSCAALLFFTALFRALEIPSDAGRFDRAKMEGLVAQVRDQKFHGGEKKFYRADVSGTSKISTTAEAGFPNVWADRTEDENLKVIIWTNGGGHNPYVYGFAYSDVPFAPDVMKFRRLACRLFERA